MRRLLQNNTMLYMVIFLSLNIVFSYYNFMFFIGNHDWDWVKGISQILQLDTGMFEGRFSKFVLNVILFSGHIFPILNNIIAFAILSLGVVILLTYWKINNNINKIIIGLLIGLTPYILGWLYFPINVLGNFSAVMFIAVGMSLMQKQGKKYIVVSIFTYILALGVYPSTMEMMLICTSFYHLLNKTSKTSQIIKDFAIVVLSLIIFKILLYVLIKYNLVYGDYYNLKTIGVNDIITRIPSTIKLILKQLIYTLPFFPLSLKIVGLSIVITAIYSAGLSKKNIMLWCVILSSSVLSAFISVSQTEVAFQPRINYYSITYIYAGSLAILLENKQFIKNLGYLLGLYIISIFIVQDVYAQKVWFLGKNAEEKLVERMIVRIEETAKNYPLVPIVTSEISLRKRFYNEKYQISSQYLLDNSFMVRHIPSGMFNFYYPTQIFYSLSRISEVSEDMYNYLVNVSNPWPNIAGVYVDEKYVIINSTQDGIKAIQSQLPK